MLPTANEIIKQNVIDQLTWDTSVNANNVFVTVSSGKVKLAGQVKSVAAKVAAERNAYEVNGVLDVDNCLEIVFPLGKNAYSDKEIKNKAQSLLSWNQEIQSDYIEVDCNKGIVILSGKVETFKEKHLASRQVMDLDGVLDVENRLKVSPTKDILDEHVYKEIRDAFRRVRLIDENKLIVSVDTGKVILSGKASDYYEKMHARNIAIHTPGVTDVEDKITIDFS